MIGSTLSHYEINAELGRGGMGIVYRATDTKLNRHVALKILPAAALASEEDRARFFREAQAAAQLHHPNIATVFEIDEAVPEGGDKAEPRPFIAMEYIEGETLEDRIKAGPLKLEEARRIATEVADALKAAHEKKIVHRDIKSANVMLSADGKAKVLDFGLAKTTHSTQLTRMGSTMVTIAFMSPEQARGEEVDGRSDLYSLGTMLYEMISGRLPFGGEYEQAVVYGILNENPEPLTALRTGVPMSLEWIVNKCLAKSADDRYQSASDLMVDLRNLDLTASGVSRISTASMPSVAPAPALPAKQSQLPVLIAVGVTLLLGLLAGFLIFRSSEEPQPLLRVSIELPGVRNVGFPTLSATKEYLAFTGSNGRGEVGLFLRTMATGEIRYIEDSEGSVREILFSPDGNRLAYTRGGNGGVLTVVIPTGLPERQTEVGRISYWESSDSFILVDDVPGGQTYRKVLGSSDIELIAIEHGELAEGYVNLWKTRLPDTQIAFGHQLNRSNSQNTLSSLIKVDLREGREVELIESPIMNPEYVKGGFLAYQQRNDTGTLVVRPIDVNTGEFKGPPRLALPEGEFTRWGQFAISPGGDLLYSVTDSSPLGGSDFLFLIDLEENSSSTVPLVVPTGSQLDDVQISPDGTRFAIQIDAVVDEYIAIYDFRDASLTQITFGVNAQRPIWSPDGKWIYYSVFTDGARQVFRKSPDASSIAEEVVSEAIASAISPNGQFLVIEQGIRGESDLMLLDLDTSTITPLDTSSGSQRNADFSPDGRYIVYQNVAEGFRLKVTSVDGLRKSDLPDIEGSDPRWSTDGKNIYVSGPQVYRVPVRTSPSFNVLGEAVDLYSSWTWNGFDIAADQKTALMISSEINFTSIQQPDTQLIWLQNWSDHLKAEFAR